ncbi:MAG: replication restart helicase PriA [Cyclobacteriaceae bacterium]
MSKGNHLVYFQVILPLPVQGTFTYAIASKECLNSIIGHRVVVPFGKKKSYTGLILRESTPEESSSNYSLKKISEVLDDRPIVTQKQLLYMDWLSSYYMCTLGEVFNAALPSHLKLSSESYVSLLPGVDPFDLELSQKEEQLVQVLTSGEQTIQELRKYLNITQPQPIINSLAERKIVYLYERVKDKYTPKTEKRLRLSAGFTSEKQLDQLQDELCRSQKQLDVVIQYLKTVDVLSHPSLNELGVAKKILASRCSDSSIKTLVKKGVLEEWDHIVDRFNIKESFLQELPSLSHVQKKAYDSVLEQFEAKQTVLLRGVTGSGKTEIYMNLLTEQLQIGNEALLLLPEIALTTQIISRFRKVFGNDFGVYHSRMSDNERVDIFKGCLKGKYPFIIGVRSAVFLPFQKLGMIIVDEEHEYSYKQYDPAPRYHARDAAIYLAHLHKAKVLLGSATPSLETYKNALDKKYGYVNLAYRFGDQPLPSIRIIDLKKARHKKEVKGHFSNELLHAINQTVEQGNQVILFQNQRGYAPFIQCTNCAHIPKCPNCAVSLTYHIYQNQLICHYCGYKQFMETNCSSCGNNGLKTMGAGTEMIEEELALMLPGLRIKRMDLDTTRSKYAYQDIIDSFSNREMDVLIGTQMVSKGLDFEHVKLVGIFDADRIIHFPDFRSHERAFQLITQVSGRSGRKSERGQVIIQSADTSQPILQHIKEGHLDLFYTQEMYERRDFKYPPYHRIIKVIFRHKDPVTAQQASSRYNAMIRKVIGEDRLLGPIEPMINRIRNLYIQELILKVEKNVKNLQSIKAYLSGSKQALLALPEFKSVLIHFDVDPV